MGERKLAHESTERREERHHVRGLLMGRAMEASDERPMDSIYSMHTERLWMGQGAAGLSNGLGRQTCASQAEKEEWGDWTKNQGELNGSLPSTTSNIKQQSAAPVVQDKNHGRCSPTPATKTVEPHDCRRGPTTVKATGRQARRELKRNPRVMVRTAARYTGTPAVMNNRHSLCLINATAGTATPGSCRHSRTAKMLALPKVSCG